MEKTDTEKLEILLKHWIEHNEEHAREFGEWAERVKALGNIAVHDDIGKAVEKMREANEYLFKALMMLER